MSVLDYSAAGYIGKQIHTSQSVHPGGRIVREVDVVVVGAGPGGLVSATVLGEAGLSVVVVEGGAFWPKGSFKRKQSWALRHLYQDRGQRVMMGNCIVSLQSGRGVGGGTLVNSAISFRTPEAILDRWVEEFDVGVWRDRSAVASRFEHVERTIGVAPTSEGVAGKNTEIARRGMGLLPSISGAYMPRSAPGCVGCGTCQTGCPSGGKASADLTWLPRLLRSGGEVVADTQVTEILMRGGRARGVVGQMKDEEGRVVTSVEVRAKRVVLAAGAINTPLLLQANKLGKNLGMTGKHMHVHPSVSCVGMFEEEVRIWHGATQGYYGRDVARDEKVLLETFSVSPDVLIAQIDRVGRGAMEGIRQMKHMAGCGLLIRDESEGSVEYRQGGAPGLSYYLREADRRSLMTGLEMVGEIFFAAGAKSVRPIVAGTRDFGNLASMRRFLHASRDPMDLLLYASHPMASCRSGGDPKQSVVSGEDGQVWGVEGLHVTDSSLFPTALGVNPQVTIMAQSLGMAEAIATGMGK